VNNRRKKHENSARIFIKYQGKGTADVSTSLPQIPCGGWWRWQTVPAGLSS
jgi:hypothetical protein